MSLPPLIQTGLSTLLDSAIVEALADKAKEKAVPILIEHFTFTAYEMTKAYQESFEKALAAISLGLAASEHELALWQKVLHSKITREFAEQIKHNYWQPFVAHHFDGVQSEALPGFCKQSIEQLKNFAKHKDQLFQIEKVEKVIDKEITEEDLAALVSPVAMTDLVLEQMQRIAPVDDTLVAFLHSGDLLGNAMRFFFYEQMRQDERVEKTLAALQREALLITLGENSQDLKQLRKDFDLLKNFLDLSQQIKPYDEFTQHSRTSLKLIQKTVNQVEQLSPRHPEYSQLSIMAGSALSSTGNLEHAERFFQQALENAANKANQADMAQAYFNLFHVRLRRKNYIEALVALQSAISINPQYALHDVEKYPIVQLLGAGGMGCVFLCQNPDFLKKDKLVVVKCFWETRKGKPEKVFHEALAMRDIAGNYVPEPLAYDYYENLKQKMAYFVTAYIENAIDAEVWLEKYGPLDLKTGLQVGLQIAKGLQIAHNAGIYHFDLKPANILLKRTDTGIKVKIIDFGLSKVAPSLRLEAATQQAKTGLFGQAVFGTLDYAPPEQQGVKDYGEPSAKSDLFAFGATMYRLLTGKNPRRFLDRRLPDVPELRKLLFDCVEDDPKLRPESAQYLVEQLEQMPSKPAILTKLWKMVVLVVPVVVVLVIGYQVFVKSLHPIELKKLPLEEQISPFIQTVETENRVSPNNKPSQAELQTGEPSVLPTSIESETKPDIGKQPAPHAPTIVEPETELGITGYDVVFAVDSTSGMGDYFMPIADVLQDFIKHIDKSENGDNIMLLRVGLLFYRDRILHKRLCDLGSYLTKWAQNLTDNVNDVIQALKSAKATECHSEEPEEAVLEGLNRILIDTQWRDSVFKTIILVGDGAPHPANHEKNQDQLSVASIVEKAAKKNIRLLTFKLGADDKAFQKLALHTTQQNKGRYQNIALGEIHEFKKLMLEILIQEWEMLYF
jgi:serine/threonine protein kinase